MKSITIEELEKMDPVCRYVIDIRPEEHFAGGTFPGAVNVPDRGPDTDLSMIPKDRPVFVMCHTGKNSPDQDIPEEALEPVYKSSPRLSADPGRR